MSGVGSVGLEYRLRFTAAILASLAGEMSPGASAAMAGEDRSLACFTGVAF